NPAKGSVVFQIERQAPSSQSALNVEIRVLSLDSQVVWSHTETASLAPGVLYPVSWNLKNGAGETLAPGVYLYHAIFQTTDKQEITKTKKIIIL
ncbi:MAG: hypothetical protein LBG77_05670, partial [Dysgonamonadaceae bacterium]|nr:hypothetical protein [Dysgonamonadaceae bacterium]